MACAGFSLPGYGQGAYAPQASTFGNDVDLQLAQKRQMQSYRQSPDYEREMHERSLQMQEQQRRKFDSDTARQAQERRYSVLDGLTRRAFGGMGAYGPMGGQRGG